VLAAGLVAVLVVADQVPRRVNPAEIARTRRTVAADHEFVAALEGTLPRHAMLFMMPLIEFPEGRPVLGATEYDHLRPYLHSRELRFSFGSDKGRPREAWQLEVAALPVPRMLLALEACGFDGILLNRRGYPAGGEDLLAEMRGAGRFVRAAHADGDYLLVRLKTDATRAAAAGAPGRAEAPPDAEAPACGLQRLAASGG
jgi:phosphoglycerol transferase